MYDRDHRLASHVAAEDQYIRFIEFARIEELDPAYVRAMNICGKE
jgi:hypothetical protein